MQKIFKYQKFSLRVLLRICMIFCQVQPGVACKKSLYLALSRDFHEALRDVSYSRDTKY